MKPVPTDCFASFLAKAAEFGTCDGSRLSSAQLVELLCSDCQFYHPDEDEQLECGAFKILSRMIKRGAVSIDQIADALR